MTNELVRIYVPSKARAKVFASKTLRILEHTSAPWLVVVEPQDLDDYLPLVGKDRLVRLGQNDQGLGYSLFSIRTHCVSSKCRFVWKMDDDLHHWYDSGKVSPKREQGKMLDRVAYLLGDLESRFGGTLGGISFGGHLFHTDWRHVTHVNRMFETTYVVRAAEWVTPLATRGYHEEFLASARLLRLGLLSVRTGAWCWNADLSGYAGGLQSFDRVAEQARYYDVLVRQYPELAAYTERQEYTQKDGRVFSVTNKKVFNRRHSRRVSGATFEEQAADVGRILGELGAGGVR